MSQHSLAVGGITIAVLVIVYIGWVILSAYLDTRSAPRQDMFWCDKHGPLPMDTVITFKSEIPYLEAPVCPICFHQRLKGAENWRM